MDVRDDGRAIMHFFAIHNGNGDLTMAIAIRNKRIAQQNGCACIPGKQTFLYDVNFNSGFSKGSTSTVR